MTAAIITIGDEILIGQITDTNSGFIAKALENIGITVFEMLSVSDDRNHILDAFSRYQDKVGLVVITGGLGPTKDDITKKTICDYFADELQLDQDVLKHVEKLFGRMNLPVSQVNRDQALVPSKATVLHNEFGSAPGMWIGKDKTVFVSLPGVPYEMKGIVENRLIPKLVSEFNRPFIIHKTIMTYGIGESMLAERIEQWENDLPEFIKLAYLPSPGKVRLRLSARGRNKEEIEKAVEDNVVSLIPLIHDVLIGIDEGETIEKSVGKLLIAREKTVATAESLTGGKIAQVFTSVPGSSKYYLGSVVAYAVEIKNEVLGVAQETIEEHSVVSAEVAREMALSVRRLLKSDYAIATTGNAGPTTDDTDEGVGVVFIAVATPEHVVVERFNFGQPREKVIDRTVNKAFEMLRKEILKM